METMEVNKIAEKAKETRAAYLRDWRKRNPGKATEYANRYWQKKAEAAATAKNQKQDGES